MSPFPVDPELLWGLSCQPGCLYQAAQRHMGDMTSQTVGERDQRPPAPKTSAVGSDSQPKGCAVRWT